ncbi:hypothetical protein CH371_04725 [Leptospira wolffii]|uniref:Uncharacterized protein n=1 Tax=Leptospira wolffii TaxID=409998 RepID=A0A2M9ZG73_9LEPT|nr:hypothetical protein CH371_04725 [Leptospira wolffii]
MWQFAIFAFGIFFQTRTHNVLVSHSPTQGMKKRKLEQLPFLSGLRLSFVARSNRLLTQVIPYIYFSVK